MSEYKRLTKWETSKGVKCVKYWQYSQEQIAERLALLEDKIENGTLIELPCKVGTDVYYIVGSYKWVGLFRRDYFYDIIEVPFDLTMLGNYKLDWFLTKAEAEARLKELQENRNEQSEVKTGD